MNQPPDSSEPQGPAERRLIEHLELLRADAPAAPLPMVAKIVRAARWQKAIRRPLLAIGTLAAAVGDGLRLLLGPRAGRR